MTIKTNVKAGGTSFNHNETLAVRSDVKAGGLELNHNESLAVRSDVKAGGQRVNHNESLRPTVVIAIKRWAMPAQRAMRRMIPTTTQMRFPSTPVIQRT